MKPDGRVFLKSEWGPIGDDWPCVSFTKKSVGDRLRTEFRPGSDVLVYVGTTNADMTQNPAHRGRLLSAVVIQPKQVLETRKIVPSEVWRNSIDRWGKDRWPHAMAVTRATNIVEKPLPHAHDIIPLAYRSFSELANRGNVVEALDSERSAVMEIEVEEIELHLSEDVQRHLMMMEAISPDIEKTIRQEISRMAMGIQARVSSGGEASVKINPQRSAPNISDLVLLLTNKWKQQSGQCGLCGGNLALKEGNPMLQPSPDRIDSDNGAYDEDNVHITHLVCNLAKNQYGSSHFIQWLEVVRGEDAIDDELPLIDPEK
ncbi:MAG: hypothetical protein CMM42_10170 [Rhodospirillaceae bacterium]|nr:hypothetical protein [Rhodospirillaceae bacterium]|tara:strand:- start:3366 stop:4313 length:948 start_codon:yes stop_codon:yes gene_type:complete